MDQLSALLDGLSGNLDTSHGVLLIISAASSLLTAYNGAMKKVESNLTGLISQAETEYAQWDNSGALKHKWVIDKLIELLPAPLRPLFPKSKLDKMLNSTFGDVKRFADLRDVVEDVPDESDESTPDTINTAEIKTANHSTPAHVHIEYLRPNEFIVTILPDTEV